MIFRGRLERLVENIVDKNLLNRLHGAGTLREPPVGYNPLEAIRGGLFHWVAVPFNGADVFCQLRCPNATQIEQCGDIGSITDGADGDGTYDYDEIIRLRNYQERLCELVFNVPAFDDIATLVGERDFVMSRKRRELAEISRELKAGGMSREERAAGEARVKTLELELGFVLPDDTMTFVTRWAMGNDVSDVKKITRETFIRAAALAQAHNKAPSDYISGVFTDHNRAEIDAHAAVVYADYRRDRQAEREGCGGVRWFLGGKGGGVLPRRGGE